MTSFAKITVSCALICLVSTVAHNSLAQTAGELVEPDVMLMIDSSASMDWLRDVGELPVGMGQAEWAKDVCKNKHLMIPAPTETRTAWQKMLTAFLGTNGTDRCTPIPPPFRPDMSALPRAEWEAAGYLDAIDSKGNRDAIGEFRSTFNDHLRYINCPAHSDPAKTYWRLNGSGFYQCVDLEAGDTTLRSNQVFCSDADWDGAKGECWNLHPKAEQREGNGILDRYASLARFGAMTYDNMPSCMSGTCTHHDTWWDYGDARLWQDKNGYWNAGARADSPGAIGGLVRFGRNPQDTIENVRNVLKTMEPLNCSPLGAMMDDAGYYFATDPNTLPFGYTPVKPDPRVAAGSYTGQDRYFRCRPKVAILISDGQPEALEWPAGSCLGTDADWLPTNTDVDNHFPPLPMSVTMDCPWRSSPEEAWELFETGWDLLNTVVTNAAAGGIDQDDQPVYLVVVGFNVPDVDCYDPAAANYEPSKCVEYVPEYNDKRCFVSECLTTDPVCLMSPREFLNEIACQGWPGPGQGDSPTYGPAGGHAALVQTQAPWLGVDDADIPLICSDPDAVNPNPICTVSKGNLSEFGDGRDVAKADRALFAEDANMLSKVLDMVIGNLSSTVATRTEAVTWNRPFEAAGFPADAADQYEFNSGYIARQGKPWQGVLTSTPVGCTDDATEAGAPDSDTDNIVNIAAELEDSLTRNLFTSTADKVSAPGDNVDWIDNNSNVGVELDDSSIPCSLFESSEISGVCAGFGDGFKGEIVSFMESRGLGDIYNGTPTILGPPAAGIESASYRLWASDTANSARHTHLFVPTNDGALHAFNVGTLVQSGTPVESWAYVPGAVLKSLWKQFPIRVRNTGGTFTVETGEAGGVYQHLYLFDGTPLAKNLLLERTLEGSTVDKEKNYWRSMVMGGFGRGVRGYYALDVTKHLSASGLNGSEGIVQWEIAPDADLYGGNNDAAAKANIDKMGAALSPPATAYVQYKEGASAKLYAAAILPGGWKAESTPDYNTGVYITRLADGKVLEYLEPSWAGHEEKGMCPAPYNLAGLKGDSGTGLHESAQLIGQPLVPTLGVNRATEAFIGDDHGRIWKIHMESDDHEDWCLELYFDTLLTWHFPNQDCDVTSCAPTPGASCCSVDSSCVHDDCCTGYTGGKVCASDPEAPSNMNAQRPLLLRAPTWSKNDKGQNVYIFGTGQYDGITSWSRNRIFSITDDREDTNADYPTVNWWLGDPIPGAPVVAGYPYASWINGIHGLLTASGASATHVNPSYSAVNAGDPTLFWNIGEKLVGAPIVFDKVAYFTTYMPISDITMGDACESGGSRVWAVNYEDRNGENGVWEDTSIETNDFGEFRTTSGNAMFQYYPLTLLSGTKVVRRPQCTDTPDRDTFKIVVQQAKANYKPGNTGVAVPDAIKSLQIDIAPKATFKGATIRFDSWSIVFQ